MNDPDHVDDGVAEILEVLHLADEHGVTQMEVRRRRVEPDLHDKRPSVVAADRSSLA